jgi:GEVED domain
MNRTIRSLWKTGLAAVALAFSTFGANAQVTSYAFSQSSGAYVPLSGARTILGTLGIDDNTYNVALPFTFTFNGTPMTSVWVSANGYVAFTTADPGTGTRAVISSTTAMTAGAVGGYSRDLQGNATTGELSWETVGTEWVAQWKDFRNFGGTTQNYNFQVRLNSVGSAVSVVYGSCALTTGTTTGQVGLRGPTNATFNNRSTTTNWAATVPGTLNSSSCTLNFTGSIFPASGLRFTWSPPTCTGSPNAGSIAPAAISACTGTTTTMTATGLSTGLGITLQWEESASAGGPWSNVVGGTGANSPTYTTAALTVNKFYRLFTTCTPSGQTNNTNTVAVTVISGLCSCGTYPAVFASSTADEEISNVTVGAMNNSSVCATVAPGPGSIATRYANYTGTFGVTAAQLDLVTFSLTQTSCGGAFGNGFQIYVDYDQNGSFLEANNLAYSQPAAASGNHTETGAFTVPIGALVGTTRMRVVVVETTFPTATNYAHTAYTWGETEDYCFTVTPTTACTGTPTPGNTLSSAASVCAGTNFNLSLQNLTFGSGVSYQWQSSPDNATWTSFGTNSSIQTVSLSAATWYQCIVTCATSGLSGTSTSVQVLQNPFAACYCSSQAAFVFDEEIYSVVFNGVTHGAGLADCGAVAPGPGSILNRYANYRTLGSLFTLPQTSVIPFTVNEDECDGATYFSFGTAVWIDYNQDGIFSDATEKVFVEGTTLIGPRAVNGSFTVPPGATLGVTGMRVTVAEGFSGAGLTACLAYNYGETHDYLVTIAPPPPCIAPASVSAGSLTGTSAAISWVCGGCTGVYYVEYGAPGFTPGTGATAGTGTLVPGGPFAGGPVTISGLSGLTPYQVSVREECSPGIFSTNTSTTFSTLCAGTSCTYIARLGDLFGDGWNGATLEVRQNGALVTVLGPQLSTGCGPLDIPISICEGASLTLKWTAGGTFPTEPAFQLFDAFGGIVYDHRGTATYTSCPGVNWTSTNNNISVGTTVFTGVGNCTPPPCPQPTALSASSITATSATINWTCASCTGSQYIVEYGPPGFTLGTGTVLTFPTSPGAITGLNPVTAYRAYVRQDCNNTANGLSNAAGPVAFTTLLANDACADAIPVTCGDVVVGSNVGATADGVPSQASGGEATVDNGVWYTYTASALGEQVTASLCAGTSFDTRIHIFQGVCGSLVGVAGADDVCGLQSSVTWNALPNVTYHIAVEGYATASGTFQMTIACGPLCNPLVLNDLCINAQAINMSPNCTPFGGNLSCATNSAGANPSCTPGLFSVYNDAFYTFQATAPDAFVTLTKTGTAPLYFVVYNGNACNIVAGNQVYCSPAITSGVPTLVTGLVTNNFYTVRVMQLATGAGSFTMCVQKLEVSDDPCTAVPVTCGDLRFGRTTGRLNNIPSGACPYNGVASTGGVNYFLYTAAADEDVTFSSCGQTAFDTRISVFEGACTNLSCNVMNDNSPGCPGGSSEVTVRAQNGQSYIVMVHGAGALEGNYQLSVFCQPYCSASEANDRCPNSFTRSTSIIGDGTLPSLEQQACSYADAPPSCSGPDMVQGVWYDFTTGQNTSYDVYIGVNSVNALYTAPVMNMALYSGACSGVGASSPVMCQNNCVGSLTLPALTPFSTYRLLVYNQGGSSEGSFGLRIEHPGFNDAGISSVASPAAVVCDQTIQPTIYLKNFGEAPLTSAQIISRLDAGAPIQVYNWSGPAIARGDSVLVTLPLIGLLAGLHTYSAEVSLANGVADELGSNNSSSSPYDASGQTVKVTVNTDVNGAQTSWVVYDAFFFPVATSPALMASNAEVTTSACLPTTFGNCFYFFLFDAGGDGLFSPGSWRITDNQNRVALSDNGVFAGQSPALSPATAGYFAHEFCLPLGPSAPLSSECNIFNNLLQNKVYTNTVPGVVTYQFEFSDPNAGFRRRIALPRNWVKFGEMVTSPLVYGTTYFCRVRVDQGATGLSDDYFGAGCDMALATVQPICTELISTPGSTFSCGVTRAFGGSSKIWAQPVPYATQYRFNFSNVGEGYNRSIIRSSYVCLLSWVTQPLVNGSTYDVKVEVFIGGLWSGYCGATCQVTILNPPVAAGRTSETTTTEVNNNGVQMWPNPVRDGRVNLAVSGLNEEIEHVTIDVYDVFGKRVMSETPVVSGVSFSYLLDLEKGMAAGVYTVNITINDRLYTQRLSVQ